MVDGDPRSLSPYDRIKIRFESLPEGEGKDMNSSREIKLTDGTKIRFYLDKSDEQPEQALGINVVTSAQIAATNIPGLAPEYFGFVVSETKKGLNYLQIPSQTLSVSGEILTDSLVLGPRTIFHKKSSNFRNNDRLGRQNDCRKPIFFTPYFNRISRIA